MDKTDEEEKRNAWVPTKLNWTVFAPSTRPFSTMRIFSSIASFIASGIGIYHSKGKSKGRLIQVAGEGSASNSVQ